MRTKIDSALLCARIHKEKPYMTDIETERLTETLCNLSPPFANNLSEWIEGRDFTDFRIHDKYSINVVLAIRNSNDFISALLDLVAYAEDEEKEYLLWQTKM